MSPAYAPLPVKSGIESGVLLRYEIFLRFVPRILETSPYDLLDAAVMNINTRSKFHKFSFPKNQNIFISI